MIHYELTFTLDYEIHGNGDGNPMTLMVEPTYRLMNLLEQHHRRLTIMADVAEILCFRRYWQETGRDDFHVAEIEEQLLDAIRRGHDVQLHIHSSYFRARWNGHHFDQCIEEYNMAALPYERIREMVTDCVSYLYALLTPVRQDYRVWLFRAANWSMMPTPNLYRVLVEQGITHDTSVYKGGCQGGNVCYDYRHAYDNLLPYTASADDINRHDPRGQITELPIYTEMQPFYWFVTPMRLFRMLRAKFHRHKQNTPSPTASHLPQSAQLADNRRLTFRSFFRKSPLKMDFNQVNGKGLIRMMKHILHRSATLTPDQLASLTPPKKFSFPLAPTTAPHTLRVILIGHSKTFIPYNETTLRTFLRWADKAVN